MLSIFRTCNNTLGDLHFIIGDGSEVDQLYQRLEDLIMRLDDFEALNDETLQKKSNVSSLCCI